METPSSMRRVTRSQASAASQKNKKEDAFASSRNGERAALIDITNDSPIVGLATGSLIEKTPSSWVVKSRVGARRTPGSGEALLRGQVKALLQKVEEEAELVNNHPSGHPKASFGALLGLPDSSAQQLLAPTPANTPQIPNISGLEEDGVPDDAKMPCAIDDATIPQQEESLDLRECVINRALLFDDSPGKSEMSDASTMSSSLTCQGSESSNPEKSPEDDISSIRSLQVGASIEEEDGEDDIVEDEEETYDEEAEEDVDEEEEEVFSNLCEGLSKMSVQEMVGLPECTGKHTRFIYNNRALLFDDDSPGKSEMSDASTMSSSLTCQGSESSNPEKSPEDDISSIRSIQVGASIEEEDREDIVEDEEETYDEEAEEDVEEEEEEVFSNLCEGLSKMSVQEMVGLPECTGKHTRFIYNNHDEMEGEEEVGNF